MQWFIAFALVFSNLPQLASTVPTVRQVQGVHINSEIYNQNSILKHTPKLFATHSLTLSKKYEHMIAESKTIEGRINQYSPATMKANDVIVFNGKIRTRILAVHKFNSFREMLTTLDFRRLFQALPV